MRTLTILALCGLALVGLGCDSPACPTVKAGASCSNADQQCPFDFTYTACDGTKTKAPSSCTCTDGAWACPSDPECDSGPPPDDSGSDGSDDTPGDDADGAADTAGDAPPDVPADTGTDSGTDATDATDAAVDVPAEAADAGDAG